MKEKKKEEQVKPQLWDLMTLVHLHPLDFWGNRNMLYFL